MAYFNIPENPEFTKEIRKFETTDPAHADLFNNVVQALINNDVFIKKMAEQLYTTAVANSESYANEVYQQATGYTDQEIADLIGGAPTTLDTLGEIANAMQENADVVEALEAAIGNRASEAEFDSHKKETEKLLGNTDISGIGDGTITGALSELNTGLRYKDIASQISVGSSGLIVDKAYVENGICCIHIVIPTKSVGTKKVIITEAYAPRATINGIYSAISDANDAGKVNGSRIRSSGEIEIWIGTALSSSESVTFLYPLRN